jgi:phage I-like protein
MPYGPGQKPVPDNVPADKADEWAARWNNSYKQCLDDGGDGDECEARAFGIANAILSEENSVFVGVESFATVDASAWFRVLPLGKFERFGRTVEVTADKIREMAKNFGRVPDTTVPINAEHNGQQGKLADVVSVEARNDGLWARLGNFIGDAAERIASGAFQYLSPEIVWGPTDFDGKEVSNVLMGLALTNSPFFGKETALYQMVHNGGGASTPQPDTPYENEAREILARATEENNLGGTDMENTNDEQVSLGLVEAVGNTFASIFKRTGIDQTPQPEPEPETPTAPTPAVEVEDFNALVEKYNALEEAYNTRVAADEHRQRVETYSALGAFDEGLPELLASHPDQETAKAVADGLKAGLKKLRAAENQEEFMEQLLGTVGVDSHGEETGDSVELFEAKIAEIRAEHPGMAYKEAYKLAGARYPDLAAAYRASGPVQHHSGGE